MHSSSSSSAAAAAAAAANRRNPNNPADNPDNRDGGAALVHPSVNPDHVRRVSTRSVRRLRSLYREAGEQDRGVLVLFKERSPIPEVRFLGRGLMRLPVKFRFMTQAFMQSFAERVNDPAFVSAAAMEMESWDAANLDNELLMALVDDTLRDVLELRYTKGDRLRFTAKKEKREVRLAAGARGHDDDDDGAHSKTVELQLVEVPHDFPAETQWRPISKMNREDLLSTLRWCQRALQNENEPLQLVQMDVSTGVRRPVDEVLQEAILGVNQSLPNADRSGLATLEQTNNLLFGGNAQNDPNLAPKWGVQVGEFTTLARDVRGAGLVLQALVMDRSVRLEGSSSAQLAIVSALPRVFPQRSVLVVSCTDVSLYGLPTNMAKTTARALLQRQPHHGTSAPPTLVGGVHVSRYDLVVLLNWEVLTAAEFDRLADTIFAAAHGGEPDHAKPAGGGGGDGSASAVAAAAVAAAAAAIASAHPASMGKHTFVLAGNPLARVDHMYDRARRTDFSSWPFDSVAWHSIAATSLRVSEAPQRSRQRLQLLDSSYNPPAASMMGEHEQNLFDIPPLSPDHYAHHDHATHHVGHAAPGAYGQHDDGDQSAVLDAPPLPDPEDLSSESVMLRLQQSVATRDWDGAASLVTSITSPQPDHPDLPVVQVFATKAQAAAARERGQGAAEAVHVYQPLCLSGHHPTQADFAPAALQSSISVRNSELMVLTHDCEGVPAGTVVRVLQCAPNTIECEYAAISFAALENASDGTGLSAHASKRKAAKQSGGASSSAAAAAAAAVKPSAQKLDVAWRKINVGPIMQTLLAPSVAEVRSTAPRLRGRPSGGGSSSAAAAADNSLPQPVPERYAFIPLLPVHTCAVDELPNKLYGCRIEISASSLPAGALYRVMDAASHPSLVTVYSPSQEITSHMLSCSDKLVQFLDQAGDAGNGNAQRGAGSSSGGSSSSAAARRKRPRSDDADEEEW